MKSLKSYSLAVAVGASLSLLFLLLSTGASSTRSEAATRARLRELYGRLPLSFEANRGQTDDRAKFLSRGNGYTLFLSSIEAVRVLRQGRRQPPPLRQTPAP